ncbi:two-component sensor histidine kinase [Paenibacillus sp. FSL A5-0031]|uniref:cache domain-containing sensor histidine kinase n=1 Tax=Paenibacillus sp. FSL A5-0031 TaxID=1920420 RepID=UPI00096E8F29|nr:sensor histidine kinase [Paenibacillus sp. FSL A5-0031]OME80806.1 two-component sensor histidine kinase [Paenibacillus sp. FSL A5-0031]
MRNPVKWFRDRFSRKIQFRLTCYFMLILLPLVLVSLFAVDRSRSILHDQAVERSSTVLNSAMDYIDLTLQNVEEISTLIATDPVFIKLLADNGAELSPLSIVDFSMLLKQLSNVNSINHIVSQISLYHQPSHMMISTNYGGRRLSSPEQQQWLENTAITSGTEITYLLAEEPIAGNATFGSLINTDSVSLLRTMDLYNNNRRADVVIITVDKSKLINLMKSLLPSPSATIYLHSDTGKLIAGTGKLDGAEHTLAEGGGMPGLPRTTDAEMTVSIDSEYSKWRLTLIQPKKELYAKTDQLRLYTLAIIFVSVLLALGISWLVYIGIASPVDKLFKGMKRLGTGNMNVHLENTRHDELGYLTEAFNRMVVDQKRLIEDHYEQQLRLAKTELQFLQTQINPHFLYNTLDSINWTAKNYEADEISEMVLNLSRFFRLSLNKGKDVFTIDESLSHLHYYIRIQQIRYLDSFEVEYDIHEDCRPIPILKLLLQPLVENAILHGMEGKTEGGKLVISGRIKDGEAVQVTVSDNGSGMSSQRLAYIQEEMKRLGRREANLFSLEDEETGDLFGLRNVMTRIKLYYGKEAELIVESAQGHGTSVTISLPLDQCKESFRAVTHHTLEKGERSA